MLDYLAWRGDLTFAEREFNEVDNLILSELAYLNMDGLVSPDAVPGVTLAELYARFEDAPNDQSEVCTDPLPVLRACAASRRFAEVRAGMYVCDVDPARDIQFSAVSFFLGGAVYAAYRGTDLSIVGWREDFDLSYKTQTPGQAAARDYLDRLGAATDGDIIVGGHSKGGNFAVYAASFCDPAVQERIVRVYSNDGPGFNKTVSEQAGYAAIAPRVVKLIPAASVVGMLLCGLEKPVFIKSSVRGPIQHDPYSWRVGRDSFERAASRTSGGAITDNAFSAWISSLDDGERERFVCSLFELFENSGVTSLNELVEKKWIPFNVFARAVRNFDPAAYREVLSALRKLASASRGAMWNEAKLSFERRESEKELRKSNRKAAHAPRRAKLIGK